MSQIEFGKIYKVYKHTDNSNLKISPYFENSTGGTINLYTSALLTKPANLAAMIREAAVIPAGVNWHLKSIPAWIAWEQAAGISVVNENGIRNPVGTGVIGD